MSDLEVYRSITVASLKMYFRNRQAIFWALFFPLLIMIIFGILNFDRFDPPDVGLVDNAHNDASTALTDALRGDPDEPLISINLGRRERLIQELTSGDLDAVIILPEGFGEASGVSAIEVVSDFRRPQQKGVTIAILDEALETLFREIVDVPDEYVFENRFALSEAMIEGQSQGFKGFLVPGIAAMAIMQAGIFGVVFTLVRFRSHGVLRRLFATPISPRHFLVGQVLTRLTVAVAQALILLVVGSIMLDVTVGGSVEAWLILALFSVIGGALFISIGFAISGWARTEEVAAPVSNIIAMPMMFLSGVFFPLEMLPDGLSQVTQFLPLTYLADGIRAVATGGAAISEVADELAALAVWTAIAFGISTRMFKWE